MAANSSNSSSSGTGADGASMVGGAARAIRTYVSLEHGVPAALHAGISELVEHPVRTDDPGLALVGAGEQRTLPLASADGIAWNCVFKASRALSKRTLRIHPAITQEQHLVVTVLYHPDRTCNAFRGLGHVLAIARSPSVASAFRDDAQALASGLIAPAQLHSVQLALSLLTRSEQAHFETIGTMIDCSRNGVLNVPSTKFLLRVLALLGYNMLQLYTEDTYKIPNEPFFGYLRGGYTFQDTKDIDDYAFIFGIELVPCIQTLGHLGQVLQWPRFLSLRDTSEVLLAAPSHPPTATLVAQMLDAAMAPVRSKRIHLGMDETHGLAMGRYHQLYNAREGRDASEVFVRHLQVVQDLCQERGIKGMIWSDMLFCLHARQNSLLGYYDSAAPPTSTATSLPKETDLVFWDYYHLSTDSYRQRLKSHRDLMNHPSANQQAPTSTASAFTSPFNALRARTRSTDEGRRPSAPNQTLNRNLWMAAGSWTWSRFWTALPFTFATVRASMSACKEPRSGVDNVFLTIWGDEGNEVDLWSSLPAWTYYAEHGFRTVPELSATEMAELLASPDSEEIEVDSEQGPAADGSAIDEDDEHVDETGIPIPLSAAEAEVDVDLLRAKFDALCGGNFDDFVVASRVDDVAPEQQTVDDRIHFAPNTSKWLLWEEPFFGFVSPSTALSGVDLQQHYEALATYLLPRIRDPAARAAAGVSGSGVDGAGFAAPEDDAAEVEAAFPSRSSATAGYSNTQADSQDDSASATVPNPSTHPLNARLVLPYLLAQALSLKAGLRRELHEAYRAQNWEVLRALGGKGESSRLGRLRVAVERLWRYHREVWMSMYKPFGWETVELRYGGFRARLDTMHARIVRFLAHIDAGGSVGVSLASTSAKAAARGPAPRRDGVLLDVRAAAGVDPSPIQTTPALLSGQASAAAGSASADTASASGSGPGSETLYASEVSELPELDVELELVYGSADQLLDYHRVSRPTYC
ncbi:hypothetical protein OC834_003490 [Tilletia horrida]|nr:hypothetical protein OC834_003490 [Tilletia horrida]